MALLSAYACAAASWLEDEEAVGLKAAPLGAGAAFVPLVLYGAGAGAMPWPP